MTMQSKDLYMTMQSKDLYMTMQSKDLYMTVQSKDLYMTMQSKYLYMTMQSKDHALKIGQLANMSCSLGGRGGGGMEVRILLGSSPGSLILAGYKRLLW